MAIKRQNKTKGVILHLDQGRQYQMGAYRRILAEQGDNSTYVKKRELLR